MIEYIRFNEFIPIALIHILAVITPGPDFVMTAQSSLSYGRKKGIMCGIGIGLGILVHLFYTIMGLGFLLSENEYILNSLKILGGCYLIYLAFNLIRTKKKNHSLQDNTRLAEISNFSLIKKGFLTNALNPKAGLFFISIFSTMISPDTPFAVKIFYGLWMSVVNASWFIVISILFTTPSVRSKFMDYGYLFERFMGFLLLAFAIKIFI